MLDDVAVVVEADDIDPGVVVVVGPSLVRHVKTEPLADVKSWLSEQRALWEARTDRLAEYVENVVARKEKSK